MSRATAILFGIGTALIALQLFIDNHIVRDVCQREKRKYSLFWLYSPYWQGRIFGLSWLEEARKAGLYAPRLTALAAFIVCLLMTAVAVIGNRDWQ